MALAPGDGGRPDLLAGDHAPLLDEGDDHALPHVGGAADHVPDLVAGVHLQEVELLGVGMGADREDLAGHHVPQVLALVDNILHLGGGEGKPVDEGFQVQARKVHKITDPVHRDQHGSSSPFLIRA